MAKIVVYLLLLYIAAVNLLTFIVYGIDKWKSKRSKWRIPESTLIWLSVFGGSIGALAGMSVWRHKTQHKKFRYGIPLILAAQVALVIWLLF